MCEKAVSDLALYRIEKAKSDLADAVKTLELDMRSDSDYEDFYIVSRDEVKRQVGEAGFFVSEVEKYILKAID